jgi:shikimate kinase
MPVYRDLADITVRNDQGYHMAVYTLSRLVQERF